MSDTPRTDEFIAESCALPPVPIRLWPDFARQLERELNAANDRIKRLEEAGDAMKASGYFGGWSDAVNKWNKAKEAKP